MKQSSEECIQCPICHGTGESFPPYSVDYACCPCCEAIGTVTQTRIYIYLKNFRDEVEDELTNDFYGRY